MKTVAIIQARMGSTRLPGKVMKKLAGKTVLAHVLQRVQACPLIDQVVVATTTLAQDDVIVTEVEQAGCTIFRGDEQDVLSRYYFAAKENHADRIVRITADCPLIDPDLLTHMLQHFDLPVEPGVELDYLSNTLTRSFPRGLDIEIFSFDALQKTHQQATESYQREHVTPYIYQHPDMFTLYDYSNDRDFSSYRWTLDTAEDFDFFQAVYQRLYKPCCLIKASDVLALLEQQPEIAALNAHVEQKELQA